MQSVYSYIAVLSIVLTATANPVVNEKRQQATNVAEFSSAANQLLSLYIPASVAIPLGVAVQSAASAQGVTGDINSIVQSALTATSAPSFLTAVPSEYQSNIVSLESAISALRGAANTGIAGAPRVVTSTNSAGSQVVTTVPGSTGAAGKVVTTTDSSGKTVTSTQSVTGSGSSASSSASAAASSASASGSSLSGAASSSISAASSSASAVATSASGAVSSATSSASANAAPNASTSSSKGRAMATKVPMAAAGVLGFVGLLATL